MLRSEDSDGVAGWGDLWGNFPAITTEYRAKLAAFTWPNLLLGKTVDDIPSFYRDLVESLHVLTVQADEPGPVAAVLSATDQAIWDLAARRANLPLRKLLDPDAVDRIRDNASGLKPSDGPQVLAFQRSCGRWNFKLKIGFGEDIDKDNVHRIMDRLSPGERFFADANQRWDLDSAIYAADWFADAGGGWFEEPMPAGTSEAQWRELKESARLPLSGAKNNVRHGQHRNGLRVVRFR